MPAGHTTDMTHSVLHFVPCQSNITCHKERIGAALMLGLITARAPMVTQGGMSMHVCKMLLHTNKSAQGLLVCFALNAVCSQGPWSANKAKDSCLVADF